MIAAAAGASSAAKRRTAVMWFIVPHLALRSLRSRAVARRRSGHWEACSVLVGPACRLGCGWPALAGCRMCPIRPLCLVRPRRLEVIAGLRAANARLREQSRQSF